MYTMRVCTYMYIYIYIYIYAGHVDAQVLEVACKRIADYQLNVEITINKCVY